MSDLHQALARLSPERRLLVELLLRRQAQSAPNGSSTDGIPPDRLTERCPLSFVQLPLWLAQQWNPDSVAYNFPIAVRLRGPCDLAAIDGGLQALVGRHDVLRTTFVAYDGQPMQLIAPALLLLVRRLDLQRLPRGRRAALVADLASKEVGRPFDLARGPLLRAHLLRLHADEHILLISIHHIVFDDWSLAVLVRELLAFYTGLRAGQAARLLALPLQYSDYAIWQRQRACDGDLAFWSEQLRQAPTMLALPIDQPRPPLRSDCGASYAIVIPAPMTEALKALSRQSRATLFMAIFAAFNVLLSRYSGQDDIVVGTPLSGRTRNELEGLIGLFARVLPLRTNLAANPSFCELLGRVQAAALGAYAHQEIALDQILEALAIERDPSTHPLFQVILVLQNAPIPALAGGGLTVEPLEVQQDKARYDLSLIFREGADGLRGRFEYRTDLFSSATIVRMCGHFLTLLEGIVSAPNQRLGALPLLSAAEREQILVTWNATRRPYPHDRSLPTLVADQAAQLPDRVALAFQDQHLSYAELDRRANQLAHYLGDLGVQLEARAGVSMGRSLEMVVGILGILKAGAAYVPLDPSYPPERLAFMLEDSQARVILTTAGVRGQGSGVRGQDNDKLVPDPRSLIPDPWIVVDLVADWFAIARHPVHPPNASVRLDNLAYVMYTSGSTGRPKGVAIPQRGVLRLVYGANYARLDAACTLLHMAPIAFDASTFEIWAALLHGARCVVFPDQLPTADALQQTLARHRISTLWLTAALFNTLIDQAPVALAGLQQLLIGGEALSVMHVQRAQQALPGVQIINGYGPTESATFACCYPIPSLQPWKSASIPVGGPISNTSAYILDRHMQPTPVGIAGELHLGGDGLARSYHNRPDLTAAAFLPNPFGTMNDEDRTMQRPDSAFIVYPSSFGVRLYRTGDLVRWREDGNIEFLGRIDHQVKLRGFRVELGEIEAALAQHAHVQTCAVLLRTDAPGDKRLVAYVVVSNELHVTSNEQPAASSPDSALGTRHSALGSAPSSFVARPSSLAGDLREWLGERLPDYMLPAVFVFLESLPKTPNGKLDRKALPVPDHKADAASYLAPQTMAEELLAGIWAEVLRRQRISASDNFFALGGHSLLAMQAIARIRRIFAVELPLRELFETPTLGELAARIAELRADASPDLPPITPAPRTGPLLLSFAQERLWFLDQLAPGGASYNIPAALRLVGPLDLAALTNAFTVVQARHESLRTTFTAIDGQPMQVIAPASRCRLPLLDLRILPPEAQASLTQALARKHAQQPFDLARGPLLRAAVLCLADADHVLLLNLHHSIADGWSLQVLIREVGAAYDARVSGHDLRLPDLPIQYADYAIWQRRWLEGDRLEAQLAYWRAQCAGAPPLLALPTDRPRPAVQTFVGASAPLRLGLGLSARLRMLSQQSGATLFMILLAAFQTLLARYSGQNDVVVGTPIAGRQHQMLEDLIGFFVNTLALRATMSNNPRFSALLEQVRERCLGAYTHQDLPFEKLIEALQARRSLSYPPLFQAMFALQNVLPRTMRLAEVEVTQLAAASEVSKFDLSLLLSEVDDDIKGVVEYNTALFDRVTIIRMARHALTLLDAIAANPERRLLDLPLLSAAEHQQLLIQWNDTAAGGRGEGLGVGEQNACLHELVAARAARSPDAVAVVFDQTNDERRTTNDDVSSSIVHLTYIELNARANQLARHLRAHGAGPESCVGVCMERSVELVVALLGVLKSGGSYVPLDPAYPKERIAFMLADSQACILLTYDLEEAPETIVNRTSTIVDLSTDWSMIARQPITPPAGDLSSDYLAYVIYTSGSTGTPKGVMISHRAIVNHMRWMQATFPLSVHDVLLQKTPFSFDASVWEFYAPLLSGARLVLARPGGQQDSDYLLDVIERHGITTLQLVPTLLRLLLDSQRMGRCRTLVNVFCGGEALTAELAERFSECQRARLHNLYGPTEATIDATCWSRPPGAELSAAPIGRPIANVQIYALDSQLQPAPIGVVGELYIGGSGLARGYLGRPDVTAERFVPNPFAEGAGGWGWVSEDERRTTNDEGAANIQHPTSNIQHDFRLSAVGYRLYRTGDLARFRADGLIEYIGRTDQQVKLRGYRIELGEIEAALLLHANVYATTVKAREDRIVAYVVQRSGGRRQEAEDPAPETPLPAPRSLIPELRSFLAARLPSYMVPAAFVELDTLPLTPNGKIDHQALPAPDGPHARRDAAYAAPRTEPERLIAEIWAALLRQDRVGVHDNFFDLGGHSLLATQAVARINKTMGANLPLRALFEAPTAAEIAERVATVQEIARQQTVPRGVLAEDEEEIEL